jgi:hypothetical protein
MTTTSETRTATEDLTAKERDALRALTDLGEAATGQQWEEAAVAAGVSRRSFYGARARLMQAGLVAATEVRYSPHQPPPPPPVSTEDVIALVAREGTRSRRMFELYAEVPSDGRLQNLVRIVIDEMPGKDRRGLVKGRRITAEVYEAAEAAVLAAVETLAETEATS